ncbi:MAG: hypothetical protein ABSD31_05560 [Candidatus Binataceae bacterium]
MSVRSALFALAILCGLNTAASAADSSCATDKRVVAACYEVHGRLRIYANMRLYLWPVGTKRLLGVCYAPDVCPPFHTLRPGPPMPPNVAKLVDPDHDVFGDFRVCPFTPEEPRTMRTVCIDSASHLIVRPTPRTRPTPRRHPTDSASDQHP